MTECTMIFKYHIYNLYIIKEKIEITRKVRKTSIFACISLSYLTFDLNEIYIYFMSCYIILNFMLWVLIYRIPGH